MTRRHGWLPRRDVYTPRIEAQWFNDPENWNGDNNDDDYDYTHHYYLEPYWQFSLLSEQTPFLAADGLIHVLEYKSYFSQCGNAFDDIRSASTDEVIALSLTRRTHFPVITCLYCISVGMSSAIW